MSDHCEAVVITHSTLEQRKAWLAEIGSQPYAHVVALINDITEAEATIARLTRVQGYAIDNIQEAREAQAAVRAEIEEHLVGAMPSAEQIDPPFMAEAKVQVEAIVRLAARADALAAQVETLRAAIDYAAGQNRAGIEWLAAWDQGDPLAMADLDRSMALATAPIAGKEG